MLICHFDMVLLESSSVNKKLSEATGLLRKLLGSPGVVYQEHFFYK